MIFSRYITKEDIQKENKSMKKYMRITNNWISDIIKYWPICGAKQTIILLLVKMQNDTANFAQFAYRTQK